MNMYYLEELLAYVLGTVLSVTFFALLIITGAMFARQKNTTSKPNEYLDITRKRGLYEKSYYNKQTVWKWR